MEPVTELRPLDRNVARPGRLSLSRAYKIAREIARRSGVADALRESIDSHTGRPMDLAWIDLLAIFITHGILGQDMHLTKVEETARDLVNARLLTGTRSGRVTYDHIAHNLRRIEESLRHGYITSVHSHKRFDRKTGELHECPATCTGERPIGPDQFATALLMASAAGLPRTTTFALDSTDYETTAARRSWRKKPDVIDTEDVPDLAVSGEDFRTVEFPLVRADGRLQHSLDPDACAGYRSGKGLRPKETFLGFDLHITVPVPEPGMPPLPHLALGLVTMPAGSGKAEAGLRAVDALTDAGIPLKTLLSDRGYTYRKPEAWALPLVGRGIASIHNLHKNQFGVHPGPRLHTIWVDGSLYTSALPAALRSLGGFSLGLSDAAKRELQGKYDERRPYQLDPVPHGDRPGTMRFRGPALSRRVRCVNTPESLRAPYSVPATTCPKRPVDKDGNRGAPVCGCGVTVVVDAEEQAWTRQRTPFGSTEWAALYGRRSGVEHINAEIKHNRGVKIVRHFTRVRGAIKNHILLTFALVGTNVRLLRDWHICRSAPDPWMELIGDADDPAWAVEHTRVKKRRKRKRAFHEAYYASRGRPLQVA
ncbi:hypothetical protein DDP54_07850 [Cellulomonas sp. WB94]|nr:hypothetical protein DDP54_07850 [Cellulomonas sp. WB94]